MAYEPPRPCRSLVLRRSPKNHGLLTAHRSTPPQPISTMRCPPQRSFTLAVSMAVVLLGSWSLFQALRQESRALHLPREMARGWPRGLVDADSMG